ncbi:MAG: type II secretion system protein [Kiritimatiellia bacterium]
MARKRGFTLIELLIVTVVIVTLMGVVFRLAGIGGSAKAKNVTVSRLQKIENALSGYYAAYGSYPPVPFHGYRDIYLRCNDNGLLVDESGSRDFSSGDFRRQVEAACRAQPLAVRFPYDVEKYGDYIDALSDQCKLLCTMQGSAYAQWRDRASVFSRGFDCMKQNLYGTKLKTSPEWQDVRVFQFGLLSFLLPRYLFMMEGKKDYYDDCAQWERNNRHICDFTDGKRITQWATVQQYLGTGQGVGGSGDRSKAAMITNLPSQSVCARWMPNFQGIIRGGRTFYGVDTSDGNAFNNADSPNLGVFSTDSNGGGGGRQYVLNGMTIWDGWYRDIYYYSEPPYQSYRLWSAGPDGRTFPPWIDLASLPSESDRKLAAQWMADDIVHMSN